MQNKNKIIEVKITYEEWIKSPFAQMNSLQLDTTTRFIVTNCPPEYAKTLKEIGITFELPKSEPITITFFPSVKLNVEKCDMELIKYSDTIIIKPKVIGINESTFDWDGMVGMIRILYKKQLICPYRFNYIKIGDKEFKYYPIFSAYGLPEHIADYPFNSEFIKGDKFQISTVCEIEKVELFVSDKINISRNLFNK